MFYKKYKYDMCIINSRDSCVGHQHLRPEPPVCSKKQSTWSWSSMSSYTCGAMNAIFDDRFVRTPRNVVLKIIALITCLTLHFVANSKYFRTYSFWRVIVADPPSVINKSHCCWFHTFALRKCTKDFAHLGAGLHLKESFFARLFTTKRSGKQT